MNPLQLWRYWRAYERIKDMDKKTLAHLAVAAFLAASSAAGSQYLASDTVNVAAVISAVLTTVFALIKESPLPR